MKLFKRIHSYVCLFLTFLVFFSCRKENSHPSAALTFVNEKSTKTVITPYGMMPDTSVIIIKKGQEILVKNGRALIINSASRAVVKDIGPYVAPQNSSVSKQKLPLNFSLKKTVSTLATTQSGQQGLGYQAQYFHPAGKTISYFSSDWKIPPGPALIDNSGAQQSLYLWNGLWDGGGTFMQPVYQYYGNFGGTPEYCIRNWAIINNKLVGSPPIDLAAGTKVTGYMQLQSSTDSSYTYKIGFVGYSSIDVTFTVPNPADRLLQVYETYCGGPGYFYNTEYSTMNNNVLNYSGSGTNQPITWTINNDEAGDGYNITPSGRTAVPFNNGTINSYVNFYYDLGANIVPGHTYRVVSAVNGTSVLDVKGGGTANGTNVILYSPNSPITANQEWLITLGVDGFYKLASVNAPGKVLDVAGGGTANGTQVDINTDSGTNAQKWQIRPISGDYCTLFPACSPSSALNINGGSTANDTKVQIHSSNDGANSQLFKFVFVK